VFNMVDRRKTLHRQACELAAEFPEIFLRVKIPYASVVEQMAARRAPTPVYAAHTAAATAFAEMWGELQTLLSRGENKPQDRRWPEILEGIESLIERLESIERPPAIPSVASTAEESSRIDTDGEVVHRFDTDERDLVRGGHVVELHEAPDGRFVVLARSGASLSDAERAEACIDRSWTVQILAGKMSPLDALERRVPSPLPSVVQCVRAAAGGRQLRRVNTYRNRDVAAAETLPRRAIAPHSPRLAAIDVYRSESPDSPVRDRAAGRPA